MRVRQLNHSVYQVQYHIVFTTKYRRKIFKDYTKTELIKSLTRTTRKYPDWYISEVNAGSDHVHLLIEIPPKYSVAEVVQKIKAYASVDLRKKFKYIDRIYEDGNMWSPGYFVSTVGANETIIRKYIRKQGIDDKGTDVTQELS